MKRVILAPDSFKGTMDSMKICNIMSSAIKKHYTEAEIIKIPVADGGEGTVDCFLEAAGGKKVTVKGKGPYFAEMESFYGVLSDGKTAVIEMAAAAGLPLVEGRENPAETTTYGVGQLIRHALENGCTKIIIGIGGSCTNDGGAGMAAALGIRFLDNSNREFIPTGGTLDRVSGIDTSGRLKLLDSCSIVSACDVDNPLCGINGAAYVFAPQKGADEQMVELLDKNLRHFAGIIKRDIGMDLINVPGAGAAGGLGAGLAAFAGAQLKPGIDIVLDTVKFDEILKGADFVLTGEGKIDGQSLRGKVVAGVAKRAKAQNVPVIAIVGDIGDNIDDVYLQGVTAIMSINRVAVPFEKARLRSESDLKLTVDSLMRIMKISRGL
ncbi:MAG: glycerate kinase [Acetivibrionales bacterium]|jgi:glycerate kinase